METVDPEAVRAALWGPIGAEVAADRLREMLGVPLPAMRPRVTAAAIGHSVRAGLLVYLGGEVDFPQADPEQVAALARRRDLPALLDQHIPLGPDQAAGSDAPRLHGHVWMRVSRTESDLRGTDRGGWPVEPWPYLMSRRQAAERLPECAPADWLRI
ncbi:hypothetical protein [Streptomyces sp. NPDC002467]|uniref:hypothetical protein n=1 Tax=Streptomyces sp. NPDC002467 TaxID=3364647 RepID=UPI003691CA7B